MRPQRSAIAPMKRSAVPFRHRLAVHEAGHVVSALALSVRVGSVTLDWHGRRNHGWTDFGPCGVTDGLAVAMAGMRAEQLLLGSVPIPSNGDYVYCRAALQAAGRRVTGPTRTLPAVVAAGTHAAGILIRNEAAVRRMSRLLLDFGTIDMAAWPCAMIELGVQPAE